MDLVERIEQATTVADISQRTRASIAHSAHARAYDRVESLAFDCRSSFEELWKAEADLKEMGIEVSVSLPFPIREAWFDWRAKQVLLK